MKHNQIEYKKKHKYTLPERRHTYLMGYERGKYEMLDKTHKYLRKLTRFVCCSEGGGMKIPIFTEEDIKKFIKTMMK